MNFETQPYIVYIKVDDQNRIRDVNSSAFLRDMDGWIEVDRGFGTKYGHAQGNYFLLPTYDERGIMRYLYTPDSETLWRERTQAEMDADWVEPVPVPDPTERIAALEEAMTAIEEGIASV